MSEFPSDVYLTAQREWIGKDHICIPTIHHLLEQKYIKGKKVLDIGCGSGHYSIVMLKWGASQVDGFDNSPEMIELCRKNYSEEPRLSFREASILDFSSSGYDLAVAFFVLQFINTKEELAKALKNVRASLTDDAVFMGIVPNGIKEYNPTPEEGRKFGAAVRVDGSPLVDGQSLPIEFYKNGEVSGSSQITFYYRETYEALMLEAGFFRVEWISPVISENGPQIYGEDFFHSYLNPPKDIGFRAYV